MIKDLINKTWSYAFKGCELAFAPSSFLWGGVFFSVSPLAFYANLLHGINFIFSNPRGFGDSGSIAIGGVLFNIGYWAITGIPYLIGKLLDVCIGFDWKDDGIFSYLAKGITATPAVVLGAVLIAAAGIPMYFLIPAVLGVIDLAVRATIAAAATLSTLASLALSGVVLGVAAIATTGLTVCGVVSTLVSPFVWLGSKIKECFEPHPEENFLNSDSHAVDFAGPSVTEENSVIHYEALQNNLPGFSIPNSNITQKGNGINSNSVENNKKIIPQQQMKQSMNILPDAVISPNLSPSFQN